MIRYSLQHTGLGVSMMPSPTGAFVSATDPCLLSDEEVNQLVAVLNHEWLHAERHAAVFRLLHRLESGGMELTVMT